MKVRIEKDAHGELIGVHEFSILPRDGDILEFWRKEEGGSRRPTRYQVYGPALFTPDRNPGLGQVTIFARVI